MNTLDDLLEELSRDTEFVVEYERLKPGYDKLLSLIKESSKQGRRIEIEEDDDDESTLIWDEQTLVYGVGDTLEQAVDDYIVSLEEWEEIMRRHDETKRLS